MLMGNAPPEGQEGETMIGIPSSDAETRIGNPSSDVETRIGGSGLTPGPAATGADETIGLPLPPPGTASGNLVAPGQPFGSRYHIIRVLGAGGMGVVYQAWDAELGVTVALKVIRPEVTSDPYVARDVERRFKRELLLAREVTHNNVVRIHDLGEIDGIKYITMSYVDGHDLGTVLCTEQRLTPSRALRIVRGVVSGLRAAHEAGVVHRDLKPANIMIDAHDEARIMDFGIARSTSHATVDETGEADPTGRLAEFRRQAAVLSHQTMEGAIVGTVEYMAPEQAKGTAVDQRADIYAVGLILYDMLGGWGRASRSESAISELTGRMQQQPGSIREINTEVPEALAKVIARCLEPDADARYATSKDLEADLQRLDAEGNLLPVLRRVTTRQLAAAAVLVLSLLGGTWWLASGPAPVVEHEPVSVLVADFENRANEALFDAALEQALTIGMEGASFITSYPRRQALRVASQLGAGTSMDEATARLISRREGISYVLAGAVDRNGDGYAISVKAINPSDGSTVSTATANASNKDGVLTAVGSLASQLRNALGDTTSRKDQLKDSETFTASSLEAMSAYARGQELNYAGRQAEALKAFQEAVALDPGLARAYAGMGVIYGALKQDAKVEESYQNAFKHLDRMSEREKLRTQGGYYLLVTRNYEKAIETYEELVRRFPADDTGHANLAYAYLNVRNVPKAVEEGRKAIEIYPRNTLQRTNYAMYSMYAGDYATAIAESNTVLEANPSFEYALLTVANSQLGAGDIEESRQTWGRLASASALGASMASLGRGDLAMHLGRHREAIPILTEGIKADEAAGNLGEAAAQYIALAEAHQAMGNRSAAAAAARKAASLREHESVLFPAAIVLTDSGDTAAATEIATRLDNMLQSQTRSYAKLILGSIALREKRLGDALDALLDGQKRHDSWFARLLLGRAYLEAGRFAEARAEFEKCVQRRGEASDVFFENLSSSRYLPPVYYWLGRAQEGLGAAPAAKKSYEEFVKLRAGSDPADPLAADASQRIAK
jgi:serine/threonine protein kinase/tetratricopeptide (TPR) repeat protein